MDKKLKKILHISGMVLVASAITAGNIVAAYYAPLITTFLGGYGVDFTDVDFSEGKDFCQDIAAEGIVMLKNEDNTLPLSDVENVSVFGWGATDAGFVISGSGSGSADERGSSVNTYFVDGLEASGFNVYEPLIDMYEDYNDSRDKGDYWNAAYPFFNLIEPPASYVEPLMDGAAAHSDTAIVVISRLGGEGQDLPRTQKKTNLPEDSTRTYLQLSIEEEDMLELVKEYFETVVVVVNTCNAMELGYLDDVDIDAAISVSGTGETGCLAIGEVLRGRTLERKDSEGNVIKESTQISPSGKTVDTYAYDLSTAATYANAPNCRTVNGPEGGTRTYLNAKGSHAGNNAYVDYAESIYVGYKWYETADVDGFWSSSYAYDKWGVESYEDVVQYPFGFGLSYTKFEWEIMPSNIIPANGSSLTKDGQIRIEVLVRNVGDYAGQDVVQAYYTPHYNEGGIEKSAVNLCAFAKTTVLQPGEYELLTLTFNVEDMKSYDYSEEVVENGGYVLEQGDDYVISLRTDAHTIKDCENSVITYSVSEDYFYNETEDGYPIENRFTGEAADDGISIDGTDSNQNITYLTREDFEGTFPVLQDRRSMDSKIANLADNWLTDRNPLTQDPVQYEQGVDYGIQLYEEVVKENDDGSEITVIEPTEIGLELGQNYDDERWDEVLGQLTVQELNTLVADGGYMTSPAESINKPKHTDLDGPSGLNTTNMGSQSGEWTSFPVETLMAQTWNARLAYNYGTAVGSQASKTNIYGWYAPAVNIHRSPFDGRNFEYYSEDSYLSGVFGAETVRGATNLGLYCYIKHFAVNETENNRSGIYTWLTEQTMREIYLKPFEMCVKQGNANAIMSSFNRIGATWAGGSYPLLTEVLRNEWGFVGSVVTDYSSGGTYMDPDQGLRAGNDLWLNPNTGKINGYNDKTSAIGVSLARNAVKNILYTNLNTFAIKTNHNPEDDMFQAQVGNPMTEVKPYWIIALVAIDVATLGGIGTWTYFVFLKKRKEIEEAQVN